MAGFSSKPKVTLDLDGINDVVKEYKQIKKYMKSNLFQVMTMDGTETKVKNLLNKYGDSE
jgi:hypothetical protein